MVCYTIPYFWQPWREVRGRQNFYWTLSNLTHNESHTVYCLTDDGISSAPLTLTTGESCLLPGNVKFQIEPTCNPAQTFPYSD